MMNKYNQIRKVVQLKDFLIFKIYQATNLRTATKKSKKIWKKNPHFSTSISGSQFSKNVVRSAEILPAVCKIGDFDPVKLAVSR